MAEVPLEAHRLMAIQHGNISLDQLRAAGLSANQLQHLVRRNRLLKHGKSVYRSPSMAVSEPSRCAALCLGRPAVVIAGPTAGRIWGFRKVSHDQRIHVLMPTGSNSVSRDPSIIASRTNSLNVTEIIRRSDGIRVTTRQRTAFDLVDHLDAEDALSVIEQAMRDGRLSVAALREVAIEKTFRRPSARRFLELLDRRVSGGPADSDGEVRVGNALRAHGVRGLIRQHPVELPSYGSARFDLAVPLLSWAVEVDLFPTHQEAVGAAKDAARDEAAALIGWTVRRVTQAMYEREFSATIESLVREYRSRIRQCDG